MITAIIDAGQHYCQAVSDLWQWDYGQTLRIQGVKIPAAVEVQFSTTERIGETVTRIGVTKDGVTEVPIPDTLLEGGGTTQDYTIYAFVYIENGDSGKTEYRVSMKVRARPKPEAHATPEEGELFWQAIVAVAESADRAESARKSAEASADEAKTSKENAETAAKNAEAFKTETETAKTEAVQAATEATAAKESAEEVRAAAEKAKQDAEAAKATAEKLAKKVETAKEEIQESADQIQKNAIEIDSLKEDIDNKTFLYKNVTHDNLWDSTKSTKGLEVNCKNGEYTNSNCYTSDFIPVETGKSYFMGKANGEMMEIDKPSVASYALFDKDKKFVPQPIPTNIGAWNPIPDGVSYIRFTVYYSTSNESCMVKEGIDAPTKFVSYADGTNIEAGWKDNHVQKVVEKSCAEYTAKHLMLDGDNIIDESIASKKVDFLKTTYLNICNPSEVEQGKGFDYKGNIASNIYSEVSGFIQIKSGIKYFFCNVVNKIIVYDSDKTFTEMITGVSNSNYINGMSFKSDGFIRVECKINDTIVISEKCLSSYKAEFKEKLVVALHDSGNKHIIQYCKWNLLNKYNRFRASISDDGILSILGYDNANAYHIVHDIDPEKQYVAYYNANHNTVYEYDSNGDFISKKVLQGSNHLEVYEPSSNCRTVIISAEYNDDVNSDFFAESDDFANMYIDKNDSNYNRYELDLFPQKFINDSYRKRILDLLTDGEKDKLNQVLYNSTGLKWNCLGDSLTTLGFDTNMYSMVSNRLGIKANNYGIVSSTIADYEGDGVSGNPMCVRYVDMDDDADIVTVMGGTNDVYSKIGTFDDVDGTTLYGACHILFKGLINKYPNAKIGVILPPQNGQSIPSYVETQGGVKNMANMIAKVNAIKEVAEFYSLPILDLFYHGGISGMVESNINTLIKGDYLHLTQKGYQVLAPHLMSFIKELLETN